jgi:ABC-type sugar transport system permease subunit
MGESSLQDMGSALRPAARAASVPTLQRLQIGTRKALRRPQFWFGLVVLIPSLIWYWTFAYRPILDAFPIAVKNYKIVDPAHSPFVGLNNFTYLFRNPVLTDAVKNTVQWSLLTFAIAIPFALFVAVCLTSVERGRNVYQGLIFLPVVVSLVAIALLFRMLMDPEIGQLNQILRTLHLPESKWLSGQNSALLTCVMIGVWKGVGGTVIILTAGMMNIPSELYDAAMVDGVNWWSRFWQVTLPLLAHTLLLITVLTAIGTLQEFTAPFVLTGGGPGRATFTYNMLIYNEAFQSMRFGTATAAALLQFVVIVAISIAQLKLLRPKWSY